MNTANRSDRGNFDSFGDGISTADDDSDLLDLQQYVRVLRKRKWPIVFSTLIVTVLAAYYATTLTPIYRASATLLIEKQRANVVSIEELYGIDSESIDYYETQFVLLKSRRLAIKIINDLNLWNDPELSPSAAAIERQRMAESAESDETSFIESALEKLRGQSAVLLNSGDSTNSESGVTIDVLSSELIDDSPSIETELAEDGLSDPLLDETVGAVVTKVDGNDLYLVLTSDQKAVVGQFMSRFGVTPVRKTKLVMLSYESKDPSKATKVANHAGEAYIADYLESKLELTTKASTWLGKRLGTLQLTLDESEQNLIDFKQANGLVDVDGSVGRLNERELLMLTDELAGARSELSAAGDVYREVRAVIDSPKLLETIPSVQSNGLVQNLKVEQGRAQRTLDELLNRYGVRHPSVVDAQSALDTLEKTLQQTVVRVANSIGKNYQLQQQRVRDIESKLAEGKQEIQVIGTKKFELDALERVLQTNQTIYDTFFNRMSEAKSADGLETANARISDTAQIPGSPIKPNKQFIVAVALFGSLFLSMIMAFLYEQMDSTVKSADDIEKKLGLNLLGILPLIKSGLFKTKQALPLNPSEIVDEKGTFSEAVNTVRTAICFDDAHSRGARKIIMVTSSVPGEGKSTTSINLAHSLGQMERVLLIDCDMRKPTIAKAAGLDKNVSGLSNLITKKADASECIKRGLFDGRVDVLPSGPIPQQPLELLSSKRFDKLLKELCNHYDRIVVDCAPTQAVSDALVLCKLSDFVVYAVKSHDTPMDLVKRGVQRLEAAGSAAMGVVMTQVDMDKLVSYGGDHYYQGYYDYYGYREAATEKGQSKKNRLTPADLREIMNDDEDVVLDLYGNSNVDEDPMVDAFEVAENLNSTQRVDVFSKKTRSHKSKNQITNDLDIL